MRAYNTRESKLLDLFEFYMSVAFGPVVAAAECPFPVQRDRDVSCYELCNQFFGTGYRCPCCALGHNPAMAFVKRVLVGEGFIPDESK
jgi:hypothetical protein